MLERLVTTSQAAQILGLSVQGVHYRIKKNKLKSIKQDNKIFVYIDDSEVSPSFSTKKSTSQKEVKKSNDDFKLLIEGKDEQIALLKKSIKWMKKQYTSEIHRLEKNQKRIIKVFNSEIKLLQSAFNEMRAIYKPQLQNNQEVKKSFISIKDFFLMFKKKGKTNYEIKIIILQAIQNQDKRFIYNKKDKTILILKSNFEDLF